MYPWKGARIVFTSGDMIKEDGRAGGGMGATLWCGRTFYIRGEKSEDTAAHPAEPPAEQETRQAAHFKAPIETERF